MSDHTHTRLETSDGEVIAYLAPQFEHEPTATNDSTVNALPGEETPPLVLDLGQWTYEITVQGEFEISTNLPPEHREDLLDLDSEWSEPITAEQQVDRIIDYVVFGESGPPYHLYIGDREFTAETRGAIDIPNGVYPAVSVSEIRTPNEAGLTRDEYLLRFDVGEVEGSK